MEFVIANNVSDTWTAIVTTGPATLSAYWEVAWSLPYVADVYLLTWLKTTSGGRPIPGPGGLDFINNF